MNMFRDGLNSVSVDNNHHDEILEISDDDSEESSLTSELRDASPGKVSMVYIFNIIENMLACKFKCITGVISS